MWLLLELKQFLTHPVVENFGLDRPFRLRRLSLWMVIAGWATFLVSCMIGLWMTRSGVHIAGYHQMLATFAGRGDENGRIEGVTLQYVEKIAELAGAALFIGGMISVALFDKVDRIATWRAE